MLPSGDQIADKSDRVLPRLLHCAKRRELRLRHFDCPKLVMSGL
jgi:hypothetical protein